jgi:hypothetical protein
VKAQAMLPTLPPWANLIRAVAAVLDVCCRGECDVHVLDGLKASREKVLDTWPSVTHQHTAHKFGARRTVIAVARCKAV